MGHAAVKVNVGVGAITAVGARNVSAVACACVCGNRRVCGIRGGIARGLACRVGAGICAIGAVGRQRSCICTTILEGSGRIRHITTHIRNTIVVGAIGAVGSSIIGRGGHYLNYGNIIQAGPFLPIVRGISYPKSRVKAQNIFGGVGVRGKLHRCIGHVELVVGSVVGDPGVVYLHYDGRVGHCRAVDD